MLDSLNIKSFTPLDFSEEQITEEEKPNVSHFTLNPFHHDQKTEEHEKIDELIKTSQEFTNEKFIQQSDLLSDAARYAETIRKGGQLEVEKLKEQVSTELEKAKEEREQAKNILEKTKLQCETMLEDARKEAQEIRSIAKEEGFLEGEGEGLAQSFEKLEAEIENFENLMLQLSKLRSEVLLQAEEELLQLSLLIARKIMYQEIETNPKVVLNILKASLKELESTGRVVISLHQDDYLFLTQYHDNLEKYLKEDQMITLREDVDSRPGEITIETKETVVDFYFKDQLERIEASLFQKLSQRKQLFHDTIAQQNDQQDLEHSSQEALQDRSSSEH